MRLDENRMGRPLVDAPRLSATVARHQLARPDRRHVPAVLGQPLNHVGAVLDVPQVRSVGDVRFGVLAGLFAQAAQLFPTTGKILAVEEAGAEGLHRDAAVSGTVSM